MQALDLRPVRLYQATHAFCSGCVRTSLRCSAALSENFLVDRQTNMNIATRAGTTALFGNSVGRQTISYKFEDHKSPFVNWLAAPWVLTLLPLGARRTYCLRA